MRHLTIALFIALVSLSSCQRGMAELKSITGDAPYSGVGNAPAPVAQPMGFWGRPRYYQPSAFGGAGPYSGVGPYAGPYGNSIGYSPYGGYDRFTSFGSSPYGGGAWYTNN